MSGIANQPVSYVDIHFAASFPVTSTPCGKLGPAAALWRYVTCEGCLRRAPKDPRIDERLQQILTEKAARAAA